MENVREAINKLKINRAEIIKETKCLNIPGFDVDGVPFPFIIKKLTSSDYIKAENDSITYDEETGRAKQSEENRKVSLILSGVVGFTEAEKYFVKYEMEQGVSNRLLEKIEKFSGFDINITEVLAEKKKD